MDHLGYDECDCSDPPQAPARFKFAGQIDHQSDGHGDHQESINKMGDIKNNHSDL